MVTAMMRNNPTRKTMLQVTMSTMTTMTTVLLRELQNDRSIFPLFKLAFIQGVLWSSRCCCFFFDWVGRPCVGLCGNAIPHDRLLNSSIPALSCHSFISVCVSPSLFVVSEVALHDRYAIVLVRGIQAIVCSFIFCDSSDFPSHRPLLGIFLCQIINARDVHDESTADSLICLLPDLVGDPLQHTTTAATCFAWSLVVRHFWHRTRSSIFETSCRSKLPSRAT